MRHGALQLPTPGLVSLSLYLPVTQLVATNEAYSSGPRGNRVLPWRRPECLRHVPPPHPSPCIEGRFPAGFGAQ